MSAELFVSIDLDGLHHHLRGYGASAASVRSRSDAVMARAVPRFLELFAELGVRATFFAIAEEAPASAAALRRIVDAGHEIASHSVTHPLPFAAIPTAAMRQEVGRSKSILEQVCGVPVSGFRAPGFGVPPRLLETVAAAGYAYDSSVVPSPLYVLQLLWLALLRRSGQWREVRQALRYGVTPRRPHRLSSGLWELPVLVTPILRLPVYHTVRLALGAPLFNLFLAAAGADLYAQYVFHGIDLLAREEIDEALLGHPGVGLSAAQKRTIAAESLRRLLSGRRSLRLDEFAGEAEAQGSTTATPIGRGAAARSIFTLETTERDSADKT